MDLITTWNTRASAISFSALRSRSSFHNPSRQNHNLLFPFWPYPLPRISYKSFTAHAKKRSSQSQPLVKQTIVEQISTSQQQDDLLLDDFEDEALMDDDDDYDDKDWEDEYLADDAEVYVGDGGEGGGISLAGTWWDKEALLMAEEVSMSFEGDLKIYAFKTLVNSTIQVRIEKLSNKSGSPSITDIQAFSSIYRAKLDEAEIAGSVPENLSLEVSSPGVERVVQIPQELDRFKERPMYVKYVTEGVAPGSTIESDGIFRLVSFDLEANCCTWGLADVRINRAKAGKGRPLSKKQREWRLNTPFDSLCLVRLYSEI
ncbi:uncharacterized protein LOC117907062 isoform X1 [Vitis riparia]|uniref:uncharacterized protein LOC117907062 isoform X1 n=1 Tax=Vitis riparia TaxID=96939 RepID=UPI00155AE0B4|nr:uncharacterized protein LOC117907062 isoform X1 [Vitis riparia]